MVESKIAKTAGGMGLAKPAAAGPELGEDFLSPVERTKLGPAPSVLATVACVLPGLAGLVLWAIEREQPFVRGWGLRSAKFGLLVAVWAAAFWWLRGWEGLTGLVALLLSVPMALAGVALAVVYVRMILRARSGRE